MAIPVSKKYYEYLKSKNLDVPPTYESFQKTLSNQESARKYFSYLQSKKSQGIDVPESFESFYKTLSLKGAQPEDGAASGQESNAPQGQQPQPSAPSFGQGIVDRMKQSQIQVPLKTDLQKKQEIKRPFEDITYKKEELPSETTQALVPEQTSFEISQANKAQSQIRQGKLPSNPKYVNEQVVQEVEDIRKEKGMPTLEESARRTMRRAELSDAISPLRMS